MSTNWFCLARSTVEKIPRNRLRLQLLERSAGDGKATAFVDVEWGGGGGGQEGGELAEEEEEGGGG
jgi:hypothetical protein